MTPTAGKGANGVMELFIHSPTPALPSPCVRRTRVRREDPPALGCRRFTLRQMPGRLFPVRCAPPETIEHMTQFHFDPATYLDLMREEVPAYGRLQEAVAAASVGLPVATVLDLGTGTGETLAAVLGAPPRRRRHRPRQERGHARGGR